MKSPVSPTDDDTKEETGTLQAFLIPRVKSPLQVGSFRPLSAEASLQQRQGFPRECSSVTSGSWQQQQADSWDYSSVPVDFPVQSIKSDFTWGEKGKAILPYSSGIETPPWIESDKSQLLAYKGMKECLEILSGKRKIKTSMEVYAECFSCLEYCGLFPNGYEIEADELVQLWMAAGLIQEEPMERIAVGYLKAIHEVWASVMSFSREDRNTGKKWYKVNKQLLTSLLTLVRVDYTDDPLRILSTAKTERHFHALFRNLPSNLGFISTFSQLRTLLMPRAHKSSLIDHVPYGFFMSLHHLQALDLSGTKVAELPSSVGAAKCLRYLDLSQTLIKRLPETIDCLSELQTLKLRNCPRLVALPKAMSKVTSLRHLDLGTFCHLRYMPPGMGALTHLYTLSNFIVGSRHSGHCIAELKNINNLTGKVCLSRLENVGSVDDAKMASLHRKRGITKLDLRWTDDLEWENIRGDDRGEKEVIEYLLPPIMLQDLRIICYGGLKLPSWIGNPIFYMLKSITLFKCENCQILPSLGKLPSLVFLSLIELVRVKIIGLNFHTETACGDDFVAFPKLQKLEIKSMLSLEEWREMGETRYFPCLTKLSIKDCPELTTLCRLCNIHHLEYLEINHCEKLPALPEGGLPASIKTFVIDDCPLLSLSCSRSLEETQDWQKMEHTSSLLIYQRNASKEGESASVTDSKLPDI